MDHRYFRISFRPIEMTLLTEPSTNDQWSGQMLQRTEKCMMGLKIPQNQGVPSPISVFRLDLESEIGKGFGSQVSKKLLFRFIIYLILNLYKRTFRNRDD